MSSITNISGKKPNGVLVMSCALGAPVVGGTKQGSSREEQAN